ncbi:MAG TPA: MFS transporter [Candidatus Dormibacteraeota bacterium]|nr:MFS transporter [Candidatus Dormibacteraeota bacterium]
MIGAIVGGIIEWYDYFIYASATALVFRALFFPTVSPVAGIIASFATFAVGQLVRPIGAIILGNLGDRIGRKPILVVTFTLMGAATFAIGLLPPYSAVGILAPILLVVCRLFQGFGTGAEFAGVSVMLTEYAPEGRRGLFGCTGAIGSSTGLTLGTATFLALQALPHDQLLAWGWRIPFLASAVLVAIGLYIRTRIEESPAFMKIVEQRQVERLPLRGLVTQEWRSLLLIGGLAAGIQMGTYVFLTYIIAYSTIQIHFAPGTATFMVTLAGVAAMIVTPIFGALSDVLGRRFVFGGSALLAAICVFPYFALIGTRDTVLATIAIVGLGGVIIQAMAGTQGSMFAEVFSTKLRYSGFAVGREVSAAIFGGLSPLIAASLVASARGASWAMSLYLIAVLLLTFVVVLMVPETAKRPLQA